MTAITPIDSDLIETIKLRDTFQAYVRWSSLPTQIKFPPKDKKTGEQSTPSDMARFFGLEDPAFLELIDIATQKEFAEKYGVSPDTLTDWNKKISARDSLTDIREWAKPMMKNVISSLYMQIMRGGLPQHYKLFVQLIAEWSEKFEVDHGYKGVATFTVIEPEEMKQIPAEELAKLD